MVRLRPAHEVVETLAGGGMDGLFARESLPTTDGGVEIERIDLNAVALAAHALGRNQGRAAAQKGIENDVPACGAVQDRIRDQSYGLHRRVEREQIAFFGCPAE